MKRRTLLTALAGVAPSVWAIKPALKPLLLVSYDPDAVAAMAAMTTPPTAARRRAINRLVKDLKACGVWGVCDVIYVFAAADSQAARVNWKNPSEAIATEVASPTFTADLGYTGNGTNMSVQSPNNLSAFTHHVRDNGHLACYSLTSGSTSGYDMGAATTLNMGLRVNSGGTQSGIISGNTGSNVAVVNAGRGLYAVSRPDSTQVNLYGNGALSANVAKTSNANPPAEPFAVLNGGSASWGARQIAFASVGGDISSLDQAAFYAAVKRYLTAVTPAGTVL